MSSTRGYGQFCPVAQAAEVIAERWTLLVLRELLSGSHRFNEIRRGVPLMSTSLLSTRLKELERVGVVERRQEPGHRSPTYHLTEAGQALGPIVDAVGRWGMRFLDIRYQQRDLDPSLLMWDIRRRIRADRLPPDRVVIAFEFLDQPSNKRSWWLLKNGDTIDLCLSHPGFDIDLTVKADLETMTRVWLGSLDVPTALRSRRLILEGSSTLRLGFSDWIGLSVFAEQ